MISSHTNNARTHGSWIKTLLFSLALLLLTAIPAHAADSCPSFLFITYLSVSLQRSKLKIKWRSSRTMPCGASGRLCHLVGSSLARIGALPVCSQIVRFVDQCHTLNKCANVKKKSASFAFVSLPHRVLSGMR